MNSSDRTHFKSAFARTAARLVALLAAVLAASATVAQTTAGTSVTIVVPVAAATGSFASQVTAYNPNGVAVDLTVSYYDAQNLAAPGAKPCLALNVPANRSVQFTLGSQCTLGAGNHFGLLLLTEQTGTRPFYGYARTENTLGIGFSTEGFPVEHFNDQVQHATGLKRTAAGAGAPATQTNCFAATLGDAVDYELRLFNDATGAQLGNTVSRTLQAHQIFRYLDVFAGADGVGAPAGDHVNVRAEFTNLSGAHRKLIGVCTVQENTALSADFRIAKSYGSLGDITGVTAGAGLTGGGTDGSVALALAPSYRLPQACANGQTARSDGAGGWSCASAGTVTSIAAGTGLAANPGNPIVTSGTLGIAPGGVTATELANNAVTSAKLANNAVTSTKIADAAVTADKLFPGAVLAELPSCVEGQVLRRRFNTWICGSLPPRIATIGSQVAPQIPSMAVPVDGFPVLAYTVNDVLWVAKCVGRACEGGAIANEIPRSARHVSLAIGADDLPVIAYFNHHAGSLRLVKCQDSACVAFGDVEVDGAPGAGPTHSLTMAGDGLPIISYFEVVNENLKVAKCGAADCSGAVTITTIASLGDVGRDPSIAIGADGFPVISYYDVGNANLRVAKCVNAACTGVSTLNTIDSAGDVGQYTSIAIGTDGNPVISYYDVTNRNLKLAVCTDASCSSAATVRTLDSVGDVGKPTSIAIGADGFPIVSYIDRTNDALKVVHCRDGTCGSRNVTTVVGGKVGSYATLAIGTDDLPVIGFTGGGVLRVVQCSNIACLIP